MTDPTVQSRQQLFIDAGPPPAWLVDPAEPIPQPVVEFHAERLDRRAALLETAPAPIARALALPQILDTPWVLDVNKVKSLGFGGVNRYMCAPWNTGPGTSLPNKRPDYGEVQAYLQAGLDFWWNYEDGADDFNDGYAAWKVRGQRATEYGANVLKLPPGMGCYASMDMDPGLQPAQVHFDSQHGFKDGYELGPAGVYGGVPAINAFYDAGTSRFGWISLAKSWSHGVLPDPGKGHLDQVGQAFNGAADTNNQLLEISGSYRHATGDDVSKQDVIDGVREVFRISASMNLAPGTLDNDNVFKTLVVASQAQFNSTNKILGALGQIKADTGAQLDDEQKILAAIAALGTLDFPADQIPALAAAIAADIGTPVDEDALAKALRLDLAASLGGN